MKEKFVDVEKLLVSKNAKLGKLMPKFMINWLRRLAYEDEINDIMVHHYDEPGPTFLKSYIKSFDLTIATVGDEQVPKGPRYIFAANHPIGSHDGVLMIKALLDKFGDNKAMVNDLLANVKPLKEFFVPINSYGGKSKDSARLADELFHSDSHVVLYPSGMVSRRKKGVIKDLEWKKTIVTRAIRHQLPVVPVHISGRNSNFFYNFARIREMIGIKFPVEMLLLVNETFKKKGNTFTFTFGKPIPPEAFDKSMRPDAWAAKLREHVYKIEKDPSTEFKV